MIEMRWTPAMRERTAFLKDQFLAKYQEIKKWTIDALLKTSGWGMGQGSERNEEPFIAEMGDGSRYENQQSSNF